MVAKGHVLRVVVVGASGLIGRRVVAGLVARGDDVVAVSRSGAEVEGVGGARWAGPSEPLPDGLLDGADAVINLAGAPLAGRRWTDAYRVEIRESRIDLTRALVAAMPRDGFAGAFLSASAVGIYVDRDEELDETSAPGDGYVAELCQDWEAEAERASPQGIRVVLLRSGLVLADEGPLFPRMVSLARWFLGGSLGGGRQWFPWIHVADEVGLILWALDGDLAGPLNLTAPGAVRQREFAAALRRELGRTVGCPTPRIALRLVLGEAAHVALEGQRPAPRAALDGGYAFRFPELGPALRDLRGGA